MSLSLTPLIFNLGPTELIIILVIVLLLFGGSRLAGLGKSSGRALKEFKEETRGLRDDKSATDVPPTSSTVAPPR
jgi:sec-independent protein translocase protein TatA